MAHIEYWKQTTMLVLSRSTYVCVSTCKEILFVIMVDLYRLKIETDGITPTLQFFRLKSSAYK